MMIPMVNCQVIVSIVLGATGDDDERSAFHKDFKIRGSIDEKGKKGKLFHIILSKF